MRWKQNRGRRSDSNFLWSWEVGERKGERERDLSASLSICLTCVSFHPCFVSPRGEHFAGRTTPSSCRSATGQRQKGRQRRWTHSTPRDNDDALRIFFPSVIFHLSLLLSVFTHIRSQNKTLLGSRLWE